MQTATPTGILYHEPLPRCPRCRFLEEWCRQQEQTQFDLDMQEDRLKKMAEQAPDAVNAQFHEDVAQALRNNAVSRVKTLEARVQVDAAKRECASSPFKRLTHRFQHAGEPGRVDAP